MRRILVLTALILATLTATADNVLNYILNTGDKTAYVTYHVDKDKNRIKYSGEIVIPDVITRDGIEYKVTEIVGSTFRDNTLVTSVVLGNNLKLIHKNAFEGCTGISEITIPASVDSIGEWAFSGSGLKSVTFEDGENVIKLWDYAGYGIFHNNPLETVYLGRNYQSGDRPFRGFSTLKNVTVSDKVNALQKNEFRSSRGIRKVSLGANITEIGDGAFYYCDSLVSIKLPDLVTSIGSEAFKYCDTLSSINIPSNVKIINGDAFEYCRKLQDIAIPASVDTIGGWAFANSGLKNVTIEDGDAPLKLWDYAGYGIFHNNPLETVYMGRNYICDSRPFRGYKTIKQVSIGSPVEKLQSGEFENCGNLEKIYCYRETPPTCAINAFNGVNKQTCILYVPEQSINLYKAADVWREFYSIVSGVKNIFTNQDVLTDGQWLDLNGRQMESSKPGLNILRTKNGKAIKVFIP